MIKEERLSDLLIRSGLITEEQIEKAKGDQPGASLSQALISSGFIDEKAMANAFAQEANLPFIDLSTFEIDVSAASLVTDTFAQRHLALPISFDGDSLIVAMSDPSNILAIDDLSIMTGYEIRLVVATETEIRSAINRHCMTDEMVEEAIESVSIEPGQERADEEAEGDADEAPIVRLVNLVLTEAVRSRANDIHIEPEESDLRIRYRIDGVLHEIMRSPKRIQAGVTSRIKIMSGLDISQRRLPQDGRFGLTIDGRPIDFRVATLPTIHGEKIVLRILEKENVMIQLEQLGFLPGVLERFKASFVKPYGAILVTGPTGSGKTTTLYAALNILNSTEKNLITVEDPVEYRLASVNQVQVNPRPGLTFAAALRSILRHDPDIVMIGEIRDEETALIAVEAALTGHLVLSTLHTNDAAGTLTRLTEMGIEPFLTSSALDCVVAQRLARRLCTHCREEYTPTMEVLQEAGFPTNGGPPPTLYRPRGCKMCSDTGYKGRVGLYEVLQISESIERLIVDRATSDEITQAAIEEGMVPMRRDGFEKVRQGTTSLEEILRVTL